MATHRKRRRVKKSAAHSFSPGALDVFSQLLLPNVLRDAREVAVKFQRDDVFHDYVVTRIWAVAAVVAAFVLVSTVSGLSIILYVATSMPSPVPFWARALALLLGVAVWLGGVVAQVYLFLIWLEERAARQSRSDRGIEAAVPRGLLAYLKYSRALAPWILVVICVVLPLATLAVHSPLVALVVACIAIAAPLLFDKFDPEA
jgi:hypothetical protein